MVQLGEFLPFEVNDLKNDAKNNEKKYIKKLIVSLKNKGIFLKWTTVKKNISERGLLSTILASWMRLGLLLMKNVLKPLAKSILIPLGSTGAELATDATI